MLLALFLALFPAAQRAQAAETPSPATVVVSMFNRYCLPHVGDPRATRAAAAGAALRPVPAAEARTVLARPGRAFRAASDPAAATAAAPMLVSLDDGMCGVVARAVDGPALLLVFADSMRDAGITARPIGSAPDGAPQAYDLDGNGVHAVLMLMVAPGGGASLLAASASPADRT